MTRVANRFVRALQLHFGQQAHFQTISAITLVCLALIGGTAVTFYSAPVYGKPFTTEKTKGGGNENQPDHAKGGGRNKKTSESGTSTDEHTTDTATLPPSLIPIGDQNVTAGETLRFTVSASDPDGDPLVFGTTGLPPGATFFDNGDGTASFVWATTQEQAGTYSDLTFSVSDGLYTVSEAVTIAVADPPYVEDVSEPTPTVTVFGAGVTEGHSGTTPASFFVVLSEASSSDVTVDYYTIDGTALRGEDFEFVQGTLTIPAGESEGAILVPVVGDTIEEAEESFELVLTNASNASIAMSSALGIIEDDDAARTATLTWEAPVTNLDGSCVDDLAGFRVHAGHESGAYTSVDQVGLSSSDLTCEQTGFDATCSLPVQTCTYTMLGLTPGTWFFAIQAYDLTMNYSPFSVELSGDIQ